MSNRLGMAASALLLLSSIVGCKKDEPVKTDPSTTAGSTSAAVAAPAGVTFTKKAAAVGDKRDEETSVDADIAINLDMGNGKPTKIDGKEHETAKRSTEVLAVSGDAPSKVKVVFGTVEKKSTDDGKEKIKPSPISGKTYIVDSSSGKLVVTDDKGKAVPPVEAKEVEKHAKNVNKMNPMTASIPTTPLKPGDKVEGFANAFTDFMSKEDSDEVKITNAVVTFKEQAGDEGVFDLKFTVVSDDKNATANIDFTGTARVLVKTALATKVELKGPITITGKPDPKMPKTKVDGAGKIAFSLTSK